MNTDIGSIMNIQGHYVKCLALQFLFNQWRDGWMDGWMNGWMNKQICG